MAFLTCEQFKTSQEEQDKKIVDLENSCQENKNKNLEQDKKINELVTGVKEDGSQIPEDQKMKLGVDVKGNIIYQGGCIATCEDLSDIDERLKQLKSNNDNLSKENGRLSGELEQCRSRATQLEHDLALCRQQSTSKPDSSTGGGSDNNSTTPPTPDKYPQGITPKLERFSCAGKLDVNGDYVPKAYYINVDKSHGNMKVTFNPFAIEDNIRLWIDQELVFESGQFGFQGEFDSATNTYKPGTYRLVTAPLDQSFPKFKKESIQHKVNIKSDGGEIVVTLPIKNANEYVFFEVLPNNDTKTIWNLSSICPDGTDVG